MTERAADIVLRLGLAFAFLYPPYAAWQDPPAWLAYFPPFMHGWIPPDLLLHSFGALEVVLALWILSGWKIFYPALLAAVMLVVIVLFNSAEFSVLFRDLAIAAMALALALRHLPKKNLQV
jgi:uncharacterized membrane protein YphA (DoxX/SURF4 family)